MCVCPGGASLLVVADLAPCDFLASRETSGFGHASLRVLAGRDGAKSLMCNGIMMDSQTVKFGLGEIVVTPAADAALVENATSLEPLLLRHQHGDWGEVSEAIRLVNDRGLSDHFNIQSKYPLVDGRRLVVVTNRERTATMVHLDVLV